jgi:hypothetical protein
LRPSTEGLRLILQLEIIFVESNEKCAVYMNTYNTHSPFPLITNCKLIFMERLHLVEWNGNILRMAGPLSVRLPRCSFFSVTKFVFR